MDVRPVTRDWVGKRGQRHNANQSARHKSAAFARTLTTLNNNDAYQRRQTSFLYSHFKDPRVVSLRLTTEKSEFANVVGGPKI